MKEIFKDGDEDELVEALRQLPKGRCDLRDLWLTEPMVEKLATAVQRVKVDTLLLGRMLHPEHLLRAIPYSQVREWDFSSAETDTTLNYRCAFPTTEHVRYLTTDVLPQLHSGSCTQRILLRRSHVYSSERELLAPFCIDGHSPSASSSYGAIRSVVLTDGSDASAPTTTASADTVPQASPTQKPEPVSSVNPGTDRKPMTGAEYARLLCQLVPAIQKGDADATAELANALCDCSREQFDLLQANARVLASLGDKASQAAREILRLRYPVAKPVPQQPATPLPHQALPQANAEVHRPIASPSGPADSVRQAFRSAPGGFVDLVDVEVNFASVDALVGGLKTEGICSLALGFVDALEPVLQALAKSQITKVDLFHLDNHWNRMLSDWTMPEAQFQCLLDFLNAVSSAQPRREAVVHPRILKPAQRQRLASTFQVVSTPIQPRWGQNPIDGLTIIKQLDSPPRANDETREQPSHEVPRAAPEGRVSSTQPKPSGASNFISIVSALGKRISSGSATQVESLLVTADAPFSTQQMTALKSIARGFKDHEMENVRAAADVVLNLT